MKRLRKVTIPQNPRGGTTLTEVLMALMCMGIGVVAVASLFPIALLRSVQATQLTSSTILRLNAETLMDLYDELASPGRNLVYNPDFHLGDATNAPDENFGEHFKKNYLIDPLGAMIVRDDDTRPLGAKDKVGRMDRFDALRIVYTTPDYTDAASVLKQAEDLVMLPDSWVTLYDEIPANNDDTSVTLPAGTDIVNADMDALLDVTAPAIPAEMRIVLFSKNGRMSETRMLDDTSFDTAGEIHWTTALPDNSQYFADNVERIRLELRERRFTWLLSVSNKSRTSASFVVEATANVYVVVFFRRSPTLLDETPYVLSGSGRNYVANNLNANTWNRLFPSTDPSSPAFPTPYPDPQLKKGGFMLDTDTGKWHRLQKINDSTNAITLQQSSQTLNGHHVVFMRGVVDVFPLGSKQ